jgi:glycosyltransferase involved in cell wall biosynthesis
VGGENIWSFFCGFTLARRFEEEGVEHIHAPWANGPATAAWVASRLSGIPFSFAGKAHDIYPSDGALGEKMRDSVFVRTNNNNNVGHLSQFANGETDKIHLIYNGHTLSEVREAPVLMRPPFHIVALGRFAATKGYDILIQTLKILLDRGVDCRLTLAGSGPRSVYFKALVRKLGLVDRVAFPGYLTHDKVSELFHSADVFAMPSVIARSGDRDGIPNVIMEALLHRVPVVATDVTGIGEVIIDHETGLLLPEADPEGLADALSEMLSDRSAALAMAEKGRDRVRAQFDPEVNHRKVLELFEKFGRG